MSISFCIIVELNLYYARWKGLIEPAEVEHNFERYRADAAFKCGRPELIDLRLVSDLNFDTTFVQTLISRFKAQRVPRGGRTKTVILAGDALAYGRARQFQTLASMRDGIDVHVTRNEFEALHLHQISSDSISSMLGRYAPDWSPNGCELETC